MAQNLKVPSKDLDVLIQCITEAHESLKVIPGLDENGPALVWMAEHLLHAYRRAERPSSAGT